MPQWSSSEPAKTHLLLGLQVRSIWLPGSSNWQSQVPHWRRWKRSPLQGSCWQDAHVQNECGTCTMTRIHGTEDTCLNFSFKRRFAVWNMLFFHAEMGLRLWDPLLFLDLLRRYFADLKPRVCQCQVSESVRISVFQIWQKSSAHSARSVARPNSFRVANLQSCGRSQTKFLCIAASQQHTIKGPDNSSCHQFHLQAV